MPKVKNFALVAAALAAAALGGSAVAGAADGPSSATTSTTAPPQPTPAFNGPAHGTAAHEDAETAVTGADAIRAQEAAVKAVGGGKAGAVTTDYTKGGYEVTVTTADGRTTEVHLDSTFTVMGGPGNDHGPGAPPAP